MISDIGMPGEDGYSLRACARCRRQGGEPGRRAHRVRRPEDIRAATEAGFQLHIAKPVKPDKLLEAITAWARR